MKSMLTERQQSAGTGKLIKGADAEGAGLTRWDVSHVCTYLRTHLHIWGHQKLQATDVYVFSRSK
ncbi:hypothetical protein PF003_g22774 [Phytophthora fragariae]|nr:hypothetical protein PF003_g22774 [Phytophthora fragariae]